MSMSHAENLSFIRYQNHETLRATESAKVAASSEKQGESPISQLSFAGVPLGGRLSVVLRGENVEDVDFRNFGVVVFSERLRTGLVTNRQTIVKEDWSTSHPYRDASGVFEDVKTIDITLELDLPVTVELHCSKWKAPQTIILEDEGEFIFPHQNASVGGVQGSKQSRTRKYWLFIDNGAGKFVLDWSSPALWVLLSLDLLLFVYALIDLNS